MKTLFDGLNAGQSQAVSTVDGPLLIIAGPGSGKTKTLVHRTLNILQQGLAQPAEIILCTFTEKAALELRDRIRLVASDIGFSDDLSTLKVGTIHGISNQYVDQYRHYTTLGNNYEVLDDLTQKLFIFENFDFIVGEKIDDKFLGKWTTKWSTIKQLIDYINKISEEMIDIEEALKSADGFAKLILEAYERYESVMFEKNKIDFAHLQTEFVNLLTKSEIGPQIKSSIKYLMVDEYQDTNYVQERLTFELSSENKNVCVVGDEDQALYRFRGATVRNILEFPKLFPGTKQIEITTNYRSHEKIVDTYNKFMDSIDWENPNGQNFRFGKEIVANPAASFGKYPPVISIWGESPKEEAKRFADLVYFLKDNNVITDYSQVALLLHSVRSQHSGHYIEALEAKGIKAFCPRARNFFDTEEIKTLISTLAIILDYDPSEAVSSSGALRELGKYVEECNQYVASNFAHPSELSKKLIEFKREIDNLSDTKTIDRRLADYVYGLLGTEPFRTWVKNENRARGISTFTHLISTFQRYYNYTVITHKNLKFLRYSFFNSFLRFLVEEGLNEHEDSDMPFPKDHVQIMTIHQSKGLEFPVVFVGSLFSTPRGDKKVDAAVGQYYRKETFEPEDKIKHFDYMRKFYVAFSRPEKLLVLTHGRKEEPNIAFSSIWNSLDQWPRVEKDLLVKEEWQHQQKLPPKKSFSFTGDLKVYETCPRQYQMFKHLDFAPARTVMIFFGLLVHQTIEDIHRMQLDGKGDLVDEEFIKTRYEFNYKHLLMKETRQIGEQQKQAGLDQVIRYWQNNKDLIAKVIETEVDVTVEKDSYILNGAIDLVLSDGQNFEVLDFKSQTRPPADSPMIQSYYKQLCIYAHILEQRHGKKPDRLVIYWTGEKEKDQAIMAFPYNPADVASAMDYFESVVKDIQHQNFEGFTPPDKKVCAECDLRTMCRADGIIEQKVSSR